MQPKTDSVFWNKIRINYDQFWTDQLERPAINIRFVTEKPRPPMLRLYRYALTEPVQRILNIIEENFSGSQYAGDGYPSYVADYGAGVNAAFCGAKTTPALDTVWFEPNQLNLPIDQLHLQHQPENPVFKRIVDFYIQADAYFRGSIVLGMTHLNNGIDIVARFRDGTEFLFELIDCPDEVERLVWENHNLFTFYFETLTRLFRHNRGYTCFSNVYAPEPWFGFQSDFSALIGPDHFDHFILPELAACVKGSPQYNFYHLDGREEIIHLDHILEIPSLQMVQWVAGSNEIPDREWVWLFKKIRSAGKKVWYSGSLDDLPELADKLGDLKGFYMVCEFSERHVDSVLRKLELLHVPVDLTIWEGIPQ